MRKEDKMSRLMQASRTREEQIQGGPQEPEPEPVAEEEPAAEPIAQTTATAEPAPRKRSPRVAPPVPDEPADALLQRLAERRGRSVEVYGRRVRVVGEEDKQVQLTGWVPNSFREAVQSWAGELGLTQGEFILEACSRLMAELQEQSERLG